MNNVATNADRAIEGFKDVRKSIYEAAKYLCAARDDKSWEGRFSSFSEFVEDPDGCNISAGFASKLTQAYGYYVLDHGFAPEKLLGIDYERAYLSTKLDGDPEENLAKARTLTRGELRAEREEKSPCLHENHGDCCFDCWAKLG